MPGISPHRSLNAGSARASSRSHPRNASMPIPVIIDCDPGTDDALALLLAFASPELDIRAITTVGGNVGLDRTLANALALTAMAGSSVPIYAGAERPLLGTFRTERRVHGDN